MSIEAEYNELIRNICKWDKAYYENDLSLVEDSVYDENMRKLMRIEKKHPSILSKKSPSLRVSGRACNEFKKGKHGRKLLSLDNAYNGNDFLKFDQRSKDNIPPPHRAANKGNITYICEPKFDGLSISVEYKGGVFYRALTRGDGNEGEDVTNNVKTIDNIPMKLNSTVSVIARCEVILPKSEFGNANKERERIGKPHFANTRNAASGILRQKDPRVTNRYNLKAYFYDILSGPPLSICTSHQDTIDFLNRENLPHDEENTFICFSPKDVIEAYNKFGNKREELDYAADGLVVKVNDRLFQRVLGEGIRYPKHAIALKYPPKTAQTKLLDIEVHMGRTGIISPVAIFDPVELDGTTIIKASLHNWELIKERDIRIGDVVKIEKAGEIIPQISKVLIKKRTGDEKEVLAPIKCPTCISLLKKRDGKKELKCENNLCLSKLDGAIDHMVGRKAFNIMGVGRSLIKTLIKEEIINIPADLFSLDESELASLPGYGDRSAQKIRVEIERKKKITFSRFLYACGIPYIGERLSFRIVQLFLSLEDFLSASKGDLEAIESVGKNKAEEIHEFINRRVFLENIEKLQDRGVEIEYPNDEVKKSEEFDGLNVCFSGTLESMCRSDAILLVDNAGGKGGTTINTRTNILVTGKKPGNSKLLFAENKGIEIIDEEEFLKKVHG